MDLFENAGHTYDPNRRLGDKPKSKMDLALEEQAKQLRALGASDDEIAEAAKELVAPGLVEQQRKAADKKDLLARQDAAEKQAKADRQDAFDQQYKKEQEMVRFREAENAKAQKAAQAEAEKKAQAQRQKDITGFQAQVVQPPQINLFGRDIRLPGPAVARQATIDALTKLQQPTAHIRSLEQMEAINEQKRREERVDKEKAEQEQADSAKRAALALQRSATRKARVQERMRGYQEKLDAAEIEERTLAAKGEPKLRLKNIESKEKEEFDVDSLGDPRIGSSQQDIAKKFIEERQEYRDKVIRARITKEVLTEARDKALPQAEVDMFVGDIAELSSDPKLVKSATNDAVTYMLDNIQRLSREQNQQLLRMIRDADPEAYQRLAMELSQRMQQRQQQYMRTPQ